MLSYHHNKQLLRGSDIKGRSWLTSLRPTCSSIAVSLCKWMHVCVCALCRGSDSLRLTEWGVSLHADECVHIFFLATVSSLSLSFFYKHTCMHARTHTGVHFTGPDFLCYSGSGWFLRFLWSSGFCVRPILTRPYAATSACVIGLFYWLSTVALLMTSNKTTNHKHTGYRSLNTPSVEAGLLSLPLSRCLSPSYTHTHTIYLQH